MILVRAAVMQWAALLVASVAPALVTAREYDVILPSDAPAVLDASITFFGE